jgi:hypothetical protein
MKRTAAAILLTLSLCAAAAAQAGVANSKPPRIRKAAADAGRKTAAAEDEVERLLDRYFLACGGLANLLVKTRVMRGTVEVSASPLSGAFETYEKMPQKSLLVFNSPIGQFLQASDGGKKWVKAPWAGVMTMPAEDILSRRGTPGRNGFKWRSLFSSARVRGREVVGGREAIVLAATPLGREPLLIYFDAGSGLVFKEESVGKMGGKGGDLKTYYVDSYATVDGIKVPAVFRIIHEKHMVTFRVYEVKHNVPIDDSLFADPNGK